MSVSFKALGKAQLRDYILIAAAILFLTLAKVAGEFPLFVFLGLAPLFSLYHNQQKESSSQRQLLLQVYAVLLVAFLCWNIVYAKGTFLDWMLPFVYSLAALIPFILYIFTNKFAPSRLGFLTFAIYWLAVEFLMLQVHPEFTRFFLASAFNENPGLISWNIHTGFQGVTLWILLVNTLFYQAIFRDDAIFNGTIHWKKMVFTLLTICIPFIVTTGADGLTREDLLTGMASVKQVSGNGEYIGKTAVWVSILLLLYSFVKKEVTKNERT